MSGAGKQLAAKYFEDMGWRVVDNLPPRLLPQIVDEREREAGTAVPLCLVCDVRGGHIGDLLPALQQMEDSGNGVTPTLFFLEASDAVLVQRFKETRRTHPLFLQENGILPAITEERLLLAPIRERADMVLDTTGMSPAELRGLILDAYGQNDGARQHPLTVTVASFGFKHGTPLDADLVFDVRFLRNPHYVDSLRALDGRNAAVVEYVMEDERTGCFLDRLYDLVGWTLPHYVTEGKAYLTIAIGCTGGKHRSVVVAEKLARFLKDRGYRVLLQHRDAERDRRPERGQ